MFYGAAYWEDIESETGHYAIENKKSPKSNIMNDSMWRISILTYYFLIISNQRMRSNLQGRAGHSGPSKDRFKIVEIIGFKFHGEF